MSALAFPSGGQPAIPFCQACELHMGLNGGCQLLYGTGPTDARVMIVGEAPGSQESHEGRPFVGEAGQLMTRLIQKAGLRRENVYVTNAVRCQPPYRGKKQSKPTKKQIAACRTHLRREIELVKPELIIAMGNTPLEALCNVSGITKYHGMVQPLWTGKGSPFVGLDDLQIMPTFHPAYALREPIHEKDITLDVLTGIRHLDGGWTEVDTSYEMYSSAGVPDMNSPLWSFDIETNARELHDPDFGIWFGSIDDGTKITMFDSFYMQDYVDVLKRYLDRGGALVGQNSSMYDRVAIERVYGVNLRCHDTQLLHHLLDEEMATNLTSQAISKLGVQPWKDGFDKAFWWDWDTSSAEDKIRSFEYNARDTRYTRMIFEHDWAIADERTRNLYVMHNLPASRAFASVEQTGLWLSDTNMAASIAELHVDQMMNDVHLKDFVRQSFNPASPQQVGELLFTDLMLPPQGLTESGAPSTDAATLKQLQQAGFGGPILDVILKHRKGSKLLQFLNRYREVRPASGWTHPSYSLTNTVNDRSSSFGVFNPQQTPRDARVRSAVAAPPGWVLLEGDYKMLELYVAAERAGPQCALYQALLGGWDVHKIMAARLTGKSYHDITKDERSDAKSSNFAFLYYADEQTYITQSLTEFDRVVTFDEAALAKAAFRAWGIEPWWASVIAELEEYGEVKSIFGSTRRLPAIYSKDKYNQLEAKRMAINFDDASPAFHIASLALIECVGLGMKVGGFIHDALLVYAPESEAQATADAMMYAMEVTVPKLITQIFGYTFSLPLKAEVTIGKHWGDKS